MGHLVVAALAAILLSPWAGALIMSCVLMVQAFVFQDGGVIALGANIFNMGVVGSLSGYYIYHAVFAISGARLFAVFIAGWASIFLASLFTALELALSGTSPLWVALLAMAGWHSLIGIGKGVITSAVLGFVMATRRDLLELEKI